MTSGKKVTNQALTVVGFLIGIVCLAGGLIFLCAALDRPARIPVAAVLLLLGGGLAAWAGFRWRRARALSPDVLDDQIITLAAASDAEATLTQVVSKLSVPDSAARAALARLEANGLCHQEHRETKTVFVFPGLRENKVVRRCSYCGSEYSVREPLQKCSNCGGSLEIVKT
jgi:hypothetical protein